MLGTDLITRAGSQVRLITRSSRLVNGRSLPRWELMALQRQRLRVQLLAKLLPRRSSIRYKLGDIYTAIYVYDFPARSKLSSRSLRVGNKEFVAHHAISDDTYMSGTMRSLAGRCYYFSLKRSIGQHCWRLYTFRPRWLWIRL